MTAGGIPSTSPPKGQTPDSAQDSRDSHSLPRSDEGAESSETDTDAGEDREREDVEELEVEARDSVPSSQALSLSKPSPQSRPFTPPSLPTPGSLSSRPGRIMMPTPRPLSPASTLTATSYFDIRPATSSGPLESGTSIIPDPTLSSTSPKPRADDGTPAQSPGPSTTVPSNTGRPALARRRTKSLNDWSKLTSPEVALTFPSVERTPSTDTRVKGDKEVAAVVPEQEATATASLPDGTIAVDDYAKAPPPPPRTPGTPGTQKRLQRARSLNDVRKKDGLHSEMGCPPGYSAVYRRGRIRQVIQPREEEGLEGLPAYSCAIHIEGYMPRKMEFVAPGVQATHRTWKRQYVVLHGTSIKAYKYDPRTHPVPGEEIVDDEGGVGGGGVHFHHGPYGADQGGQHHSALRDPTAHLHNLAAAHSTNQLVRHYSLQGAESGLAADYLKRKHVVRVRAEGEQFLLQAKDDRAVIDWIEAVWRILLFFFGGS
jgi:hypothetical protein